MNLGGLLALRWDMNKKILIGSLVAVVILILVSFTGVVGYQTTKSSNIAKASPLFTVRTSRAIDEESKGLSCDYVGKGEDITISLPTYNNRNTQLQKVIDVISKMDDTIFKGFLNLIINQIQKDDEQEDVNINEIINTVYQVRNHPDRIIFDYTAQNSPVTWGGVFLSTVCWTPGCYILSLILILVYVLLGIPLTCSFEDCPTL